MTRAHVFTEANFLCSIFDVPSKRQRDALELRARFDAGKIKLYVPYLCFQEARHLISRKLPDRRYMDLREFHRFAETAGTADWDFEQVKKLLDAATAEVNRAKATFRREMDDFAQALGDGILHANKEVFDLLESLDLDDDNLEYNDKLILSSVLVKAKELHASGEAELYFASLDKKHLQPANNRPKLTQYYSESGLTFISRFQLPDASGSSA